MDEQRRREVLEEYEQLLQKALALVTWTGIMEGRFGAVALSEMRLEVFKALNREAEGQYAVSSTYFTASGDRKTVLQQARLRHAHDASNRFAELVPKEEMTNDQLYVRSRILMAAGDRAEAEKLLGMLVDNRRTRTPDETALGFVALGTIWHLEGRNQGAGECFEQAFLTTSLLSDSTRVIILRTRAQYRKGCNDKEGARADLAEAIEIADAAKLDGQAEKAREELGVL